MHLIKNLPKLVNFCVANLRLRVEEKSNTFIILYYFTKGKNEAEMQRALYGESAITD